MKFDVNEFVNARDEWHYIWSGFFFGWSLGVALGLFLASRLLSAYDRTL